MSMVLAATRRLSVVQVTRMLSSAVTKTGGETGPTHVVSIYEDTPTHTNQHWHPKDPRFARFLTKTKLVNDRFGIDLNAETKAEASTKRIIGCDGGHPRLGHPKVFINLDKPGSHECEWCGKRFYLDHSKAEHHH